MLKYHSLRDKIFRIKNLQEAFKKVKKNKGKAGLDRVSIKQFEKELDKHILSIHNQLKTEKYKPNPVLRVYIPKDKNNFRPLGIPTVKDRVVQQAFRQIIEPIFEEHFSEFSFGFRPKRSCHDAIKTIDRFKKEGFRYVLDTDIKAFYENIPHHIIMKQLCKRIADGWVLSSIENMLKARIMEDGILYTNTKGVPQGGVISPLLANLVGDIIDKEIEKSKFKFVRYADDFVVMAKKKEQLPEALVFVKEIIEDKLGMELSVDKTELTTFKRGFSFLGYHFSNRHIGISQKSIHKLKDNIRKVTRRSQGINLQAVINKVNPIIVGYVNYFFLASAKKKYEALDCWLRMRLRCIKYSRKKKADNRRFLNKRFRKMKLISFEEHYLKRKT